MTFSVEQGEFFGVIGPNGSGKSTLLRILAGIYVPDSGRVTVNGLLSPFIELGVGFNLELTARDNIRINGDARRADQARARREVRRDRRVRRARALRRPEAEELLVGDARAARLLDRDPDPVRRPPPRRGARRRRPGFQEKCFATFERFKAEGKTVVFVSHALDLMERFCDRVLLIQDGRAELIGSTQDAINAYRQHVAVA